MFLRKSLLMLAAVISTCGLSSTAPARSRHHDRDRLAGSGKLETRSFDLRGWDSLRLDGSMDIELKVGDAHSATVKLDDNLFDNLVLEVRDGTLFVDWRKECDADDQARLTLTAPSFVSLEINGAGDVKADGFAGGEFDLRVRGAGDVELSGRVDALDIRVDGAGDIDAADLAARNVEVVIAGAGDVDVSASESLDGTIQGAGDITYRGDPAKVRTKVAGVGGIARR
ncbi:MAG: head GIN domain-containing protein [Vicinamibacterales bacterium]|nr:head GIN domain-containing protein [Vicinamibacterales bacterium]